MSVLDFKTLDVKGKRVLIREDLNVPIKNGKVVSDARIRAALPTIKYALSAGAIVMVMSHLGRPEEGMSIAEQPEMSMAPVADYLSKALGADNRVKLVEDYLEDAFAPDSDNGTLYLFENVRINTGEKKNDLDLAKRLAGLCDVFVMDAFGSAHRAHASTNAIANHVDQVCAGYLMESELEALNNVLKSPEKPVFAILGGAKVSSKLLLLERLSESSENVFVGGGILNTFIAAAGFEIGQSLYEAEMLDIAKSIMTKTTIPIPVDVIVSKSFDEKATGIVRFVEDVREDLIIEDQI